LLRVSKHPANLKNVVRLTYLGPEIEGKSCQRAGIRKFRWRTAAKDPVQPRALLFRVRFLSHTHTHTHTHTHKHTHTHT